MGARTCCEKQMKRKVELRLEPIVSQEVESVSCIADLREQLGMTQRDLANYVGVTESTIANWETGRRGLELFHRLIKLCRALECGPEDLVKYVPPNNGGNETTKAVKFSEILDLLGTNPSSQYPDRKELREKSLGASAGNQAMKSLE